MFLKLSLKLRLTFFICTFTILSTILLSHFVSQYSSEQIIKDQGLLLKEVALSMANRLGQDMNTRSAEIEFLAHMELIRNPSTPLEQKLKIFEDMKRAYPYYAWLGMTDDKGNILTGTDGLLIGKNVFKRTWFIEGSKGLHFGDAHDAFLLAKLMPKPKWDDLPLRLVDVSAPILDKQGNLLGVICGHLSVDWAFEARIRMLGNLSKDSVDLIVLNKEGKVLMGTPSLPSLEVDLSALQSWQDINKDNDAIVETWPDNQNYLTAGVSKTAFRSRLNMEWSIIARKLELEALEPAFKVKERIYFIGILTSIVLGILIWLFIGRQLKPLENVSRAAEKIQRADINADSIPHLEGNDEIATFARSLTSLVTSLQSRNEELMLTNRIFEESGQGILITDKNQKIIRVNKSFTEITKYTAEEIKGKTPTVLASGKHDDAFYKQMWKSLLEYGIWSGEVWNRNKQGKIYPEWLNLNILKNDKGEVTHYIALFDDITEKKEYEQKLIHLANYDVLTSLPNRNLLQEHIRGSIEQIEASDGELALLFIDLDKFKHINDTMGHSAGDNILQEVAGRFLNVISSSQTLARWGGDEFVVLLPGVDAIHAKQTGQKLIDTLTRSFIIDSASYHITASVGIALFPSDSRSVDGLLRCADTAMYKAKKEAENTCQLYESEMNESVQQFLRIDNAIRQSLRNNGEGLSLVFQPQYTIDGKQIIGAEALIRYQDPEFGIISPGEFIPIVEETRQIIQLGNWIIEQAIKQFKEVIDHCHLITLSINCSTQQILSDNFISHLVDTTRKYDVPSKFIRIEVTESAIMSDEQKASNVLKKARALGFSVSIDDFGTGFSCLHYIQKIHPDEIKVDQSFVQLSDVDEDSKNIILFTVGLAKSMEIDIVAEGVETQAQLDILKLMGDMTIQGYLYSKPITFDELKRLLC
ncbi:MAG: EAL domain-containing protein [gamma proteobacterium symbiont of Taylorina sp.]|nr:EAL domain-containing protein [gamma proteobacterium symbiont of Taylorina sp.]